MSRETIFKEGAWIGGYEFSNSTRLKADIAKKEADVAYYKERLLAMCMATPKDITPKDDNPIEHIHFSFIDLWEALQDEMFALGDLYTIQNNEDCIDIAE